MSQVFRVLFVDDNSERVLTSMAAWSESGLLADGCASVATVDAAIDALDNGDFEVLVIDAGLAQTADHTPFERLTAASRDHGCAVVASTVGRAEREELAALEAGADECVHPNSDAQALARDLRRACARHRAKRQLSAHCSRRASRQAFDAAVVPMWVGSTDGELTEVNDAMCSLLSMPRTRLLGRPLQAFLHPDEHPETEHSLRLLDTGQRDSVTREQRFLDADGQEVWAIVGQTTIQSDDGGRSALLGHAQDITSRRRHEERLRHLADHDPLTGMLNRRGFDRELVRHISRVSRYGASGSLLMVDLDNFKAFNDQHGHAAGDELIATVSTGLHARLRVGDILGRLGGDEFAILLPEADHDQAATVATTIISYVRNAGASSGTPNADYQLSASVGIFTFADDGPFSPERTLIAADLAMYEAKSQGRNCFCHYEPHLAARTPRPHRPVTET